MRQALSSRAELPVHETDRWFRILAESTSTAIFVYRADRVLYVNPACEELTGYSSEELLPMLPVGDRRPGFRRRCSASASPPGCAAIRRSPTATRSRILTKDGRERWFDFTSATIELEDGEPVALATAVDITERKLGEERLRAIVEGTSSTTGTDFLRSLVRHLASALGMEYAFVSEVVGRRGDPRPPARPLGGRRLQRAVRVRPPRHPLRARRRPRDSASARPASGSSSPDDRWLVADPHRELHRRAALRPRATGRSGTWR